MNNPEIQSLLQRFESTINQGTVQYYDTDELEIIIDSYIANDQLDKAQIALDYAVRLHPNSTEIQCSKSKLHLLKGEYEQAIYTLENIANLEPDYIAILAECHLRMYNFDKSKQLFSQYLTCCNPNELEPIFADIASLYNGHNQPQLALEFIENGIALFPKSNSIITEKALALEQLGQLEEAAELFTQSLDADPYQYEIWGMLGSILYRQEKFTEALNAYDYTLAINPNDLSAKLQRANCLFNLAEYTQAIEPYEEYLKENPNDEYVTTFLAETYENIDELEKAETLYKRAIALNKNIIEAWVGLAACQHTLGNLEEAYKTIRHIDRQYPKHLSIVHSMWQIEVDLARTRYDESLMRKALSHLRFCLKHAPNDPILNYEIGNLYINFGEFDKAIKYYEGAYNQPNDLKKLPLAMSITYYALYELEKSKHFYLIAKEYISNAEEIFLSLFPDAKLFLK